jgi:L,D-transpeptidase catalytic domain
MLQHDTSHHVRRLTLALGLALSATACGHAPPPAPAPAPEAAPVAVEEPPLRADRRYVVVDVDRNELRFMDGDRVLWSAPVGTGTGFRLRKDSTAWDFVTPSGVMYVQYKELNPTWEIPDWYFIENHQPVPPANSPLRKEPGGLGAAAVYLGSEIAIHGTDKPQLLGKRVSHGCIRLSNTNALRLFHDVQVGTPVLIQGRQEVVGEMPDSAAAFTKPHRGQPPRIWRSPYARTSTAALLRRLDRDLAAPDTSTAWVLSASDLVERGLKDDSLALRGVLARAGQAKNEARDREYGAFLADAFTRGAFRATVSLSKISAAARDRAAEAIVESTMGLYHGRYDSPGAPWPTSKVPKWRLGPLGQSGWTALLEAEARYRAGHSGGTVARAGAQ